MAVAGKLSPLPTVVMHIRPHQKLSKNVQFVFVPFSAKYIRLGIGIELILCFFIVSSEPGEGEDADTDEDHQEADLLVHLAQGGEQALQTVEMPHQLKIQITNIITRLGLQCQTPI